MLKIRKYSAYYTFVALILGFRGTSCEIHTGALGEVVKGSGQATVWTNYHIAL
jgi:hypothetical protein